MYVSTFLTLQSALSGVEAAQEELSTTSNNITNASTADYEDESVNLVENTPLTIAGGRSGDYEIGTGVNAQSIANASDPYVDSAWRQANSNASSASTSESYLSQIDTLVGEPSKTGISNELATFWKDWSSLSSASTGSSVTSAKQAVVDDGEQLASLFNTLGSSLTGSGSDSVLSQAQTQYADLMAEPTGTGATGGQVYNDAYQIASLNNAIVQAQQGGTADNSLINQRNAAIDDLSSLGNVSVTSNSDGSVSVYFGGVTSTALVSDPVGASNAGSEDPGNNFSGSWMTAWNTQFSTANTAAAAAAASSGTTQSAAALSTTVGGALGALIGLTGYSASGVATASNAATSIGTIGTLSSALNGVVSSLVSEVNSPTSTTTGTAVTLSTDFFTASGTTATTLAVNPTLVSDASSLQTSTTSDAGANDVALDEAANSGGKADSAFEAFVAQVGDYVSNAKDSVSTTSAVSTQVSDQRQSVEGVDLSQEMENLIQEQQAYEASAKVMNAFSTVMDSLFSAVGA